MEATTRIRLGIRRKLLTTMIGLIICLLATVTFMHITAQKKILEKELEERISFKKALLIERGKSLSNSLARQAENDIAAYNYSNIIELINKAVTGNKELSFAILMNRSYVAFIHTLHPKLQQETIKDDEAIFAVGQQEFATNEYKKDGSDYIEFITPFRVSTEPWGVLRLAFSLDALNQEIVNSRREIFGLMKLMIFRSIVTSILFVAIGSVIVIIVSTRVSKPLTRLTKSSYEIAKGNFAAAEKVQIQSNDEIGVLANAFVKMSVDLKKSYEKLEDYSKTLEQRVAERTSVVTGTNAKLEDEIRERKRAEEELQERNQSIQLLQKIAVAANEASSFDAVAQYAIDQVCAYTGWPVGHVYVVIDEVSGELGPTSIWHLDDPTKFQTFREVTECTTFKVGIGLPGRVTLAKKPAWIIDVNKDPNFPRANLAVDIGVKAAFGFPVLAGKDILAVMEFFSEEAKKPNERLLKLMGSVGSDIGRVFERQQAEVAIMTANVELKRTLDDLKKAQGQLVESEKMVSLGGLVAGIAHEINTPIGIGVTAASVLHDKTNTVTSLFRDGELKKSDLATYVETCTQSSKMILSNLNRASGLIRSFKQVAVDQSSEDRRIFKVREYLDEILLSLRPKLKKTKHIITILCDQEIEVDSYPGAFSQIITNLILNSLMHAYDDTDEINLIVDVQREGNRVFLKYSDDGKGMSKVIQGEIFEPFFTTKRGQGGSGLGLYLVYNLVTQKLKGSIKCKSQVGKGTSFHITFPIKVDGKRVT